MQRAISNIEHHIKHLRHQRTCRKSGNQSFKTHRKHWKSCNNSQKIRPGALCPSGRTRPNSLGVRLRYTIYDIYIYEISSWGATPQKKARWWNSALRKFSTEALSTKFSNLGENTFFKEILGQRRVRRSRYSSSCGFAFFWLGKGSPPFLGRKSSKT